MTIREIDPLRDPRWPELVRRHPAASVFHTVGWLKALKQTYGYEPSVLTACAATDTLTNGLVFCRVNSWATGRRLVSLPFSDHCELLADDVEAVGRLASALAQKSRSEDARYMELRPVSALQGLQPSTACSQKFYLHRLDLRPGLNAVNARFHRDCIQRKIRRAEREALTVTEGRTTEILNQFYRLVVHTRRRQGLPPQPMKWFKTLAECLGPGLTIRIASKNDQPIAGILTLQHNHSVVYKYGASDERFHNLGGMPFLFWRAIQDAIASGLGQLDLGRSDQDNLGLIAFKDHLGAERILLSYYRSPEELSKPRSEAPWYTGLANRVLSHVPDACLRTMGSLVYRHLA